jgi:hypothetical protein
LDETGSDQKQSTARDVPNAPFRGFFIGDN